MKFHKLILCLSAVGAFSTQAFAQQQPLFQELACPNIGDEYEQMLAKLDTIKTAIKKDANCEAVELEVKNLKDLVTTDREAVMEIVSNSSGSPLTDAQSKTVRDYAENVTKKVAALNDLFTGSNYCFRDDKPDNQLTTLAGFVGEASNLVSTLSGPWGAPIAIAGNIIAGFMTGLDAVYKTRAGFDFSQPSDWKSYVHNLCSYHGYRDQIQSLLNPQERLQQLAVLRARLDEQIKAMSAQCEECRNMEAQFEAQKAQGPEAVQTFFGTSIATANHAFAKPYGTYMIQSLGLRDWVAKEEARVKREARTYWADASGRHMLSQARADIEDFLITREGPKFIKFGSKQAVESYLAFQDFANDEGRALANDLSRTGVDLSWSGDEIKRWNPSPVVFFETLVLRPIDWSKTGMETEELQFRWSTFRNQSVERFRTAQASLQVVQSFCAFFRHASLYDSDMSDACRRSDVEFMIGEQNGLADKLVQAGIWGVAQPLTQPQNLFLSRIQLLTREIENRAITR